MNKNIIILTAAVLVIGFGGYNWLKDVISVVTTFSSVSAQDSSRISDEEYEQFVNRLLSSKPVKVYPASYYQPKEARDTQGMISLFREKKFKTSKCLIQLDK